MLNIFDGIKGLSQRPNSYADYMSNFNWSGISFPVKLKDISTFEKNNNISVNVYGIEKVTRDNKVNYEIVGPLYYRNCNRQRHVNLLYLENELGVSHYCWIKNFSRLLNNQVSKNTRKLFFCDACLHYFSSADELDRHTKHDCNHIYTALPDDTFKLNKLGESVPANRLQFQNYQNQITAPVVIYADFESLLLPLDRVENDPRQPFSTAILKHEPYSWAYYVKSNIDDTWSSFQTYRGGNAAQVFVTKLENEVKNIYNKYWKNPKPMEKLNADQLLDYKQAAVCNICKKPFNTLNFKCKDHCHISGKFRGAAHSICNLNFRLHYFIPVFFHNLAGYDAHLFIKQLAGEVGGIEIIPTSTEKYITFSKRICVDKKILSNGEEREINVQLRFIDSFRFMASSLDKLSKNLDAVHCTELKKFFPDDEKFNLLKRKGIFPYSFIDNIEKLNETNLPPHEKFYNEITCENVTFEEYERAKKIWNMFDCKTLGDYSDIYLKSDVLLCLDCHENPS